MQPTLYSIVLAAGRGRRLSPVTGAIPKQFWAPPGARTLLEQTLERMADFVPPSRLVTVVDQSQREYATAIAARTPLGCVAVQAGDCGTAAGVLRGLAELPARGDDLVVVTPSDHGIERPKVFSSGLTDAISAVQSHRAEIVLLAVQPTSPAGDFGWILPSFAPGRGEHRFGRVRAFVEKPPPMLAAALFADGGVWNTMVFVARVSSLIDLYRESVPALAKVFADAAEQGVDRSRQFLAEAYAHLQPTDFSRDVLAPSSDLHVYVWPDTVGWTDLGTPDRLNDWLNVHRGKKMVAASAGSERRRRSLSRGA